MITDPVGRPDHNVGFSVPLGTQSMNMADATVVAIHTYEKELSEGEGFGNMKLDWLPTNRVLMTTQGGGQFVCYMTDPAVDARLVLDDYVPEVGRDIDGKTQEDDLADLIPNDWEVEG